MFPTFYFLSLFVFSVNIFCNRYQTNTKIFLVSDKRCILVWMLNMKLKSRRDTMYQCKPRNPGKNCPRNRFWNVLCQQPFLFVNYMELMERSSQEWKQNFSISMQVSNLTEFSNLKSKDMTLRISLDYLFLSLFYFIWQNNWGQWQK